MHEHIIQSSPAVRHASCCFVLAPSRRSTMASASGAASGSDPPAPKVTSHLLKWVKECAATIPKRDTKTGLPVSTIDSNVWGDISRVYPNPSIYTDLNLDRGTECVEQFQCAFTRVVFLDVTTFWHHVYPRVQCIECGSCEHTTTGGWNETLRRVASKEGTMYVYGRQYRCTKCDIGFNAFNAEVIAALPDVIKAQLPFVVTSKRAIIGRCDLDQLERDACTGTSFAQISASYKETNLRRYTPYILSFDQVK